MDIAHMAATVATAEFILVATIFTPFSQSIRYTLKSKMRF